MPVRGGKRRALLALLLLNANEIVSRDRLIDELWGDEPPDTAVATVQVHVSRLRKVLSDGLLVTQAPGYVLRVDPEQVDVHRFERLVRERRYDDALALWRGPPLAEFAYEPFAQLEIARLEELRLAALEERIEADLARGRHAQLVGELERLIALHPLRERLRGQLMLALYRSGRQAEALEAYQAARRTLVDELGIEPGAALQRLEKAILRHDADVELVTPAAEETEPIPEVGQLAAPRKRRVRVPALAAAVLGLVVALTAALWTLDGDDAARSVAPVQLQGNSVVAIDPRTGRVRGEARIGGRPGGIAVGLGSVWVANVDDETLVRVDPRTRRVVDTIGLGTVPTSLAVGGGSVWVLSWGSNAVLEVDPTNGDVVAMIKLPPTSGGNGAFQIVFARGYVWVRSWPPGQLMRIDPKTHALTEVARDVRTVASGGGALWAIVGTNTDRLRRYDPPGEAIRLDRLGALEGPGTLWLAADASAVWAGLPDGSLWRFAPDTNRVTASVALRRTVRGIVVAPRAVWVLTDEGDVLRVDPDEERVEQTIGLGVHPPQLLHAIVAGEGAVWVAALER